MDRRNKGKGRCEVCGRKCVIPYWRCCSGECDRKWRRKAKKARGAGNKSSAVPAL